MNGAATRSAYGYNVGRTPSSSQGSQASTSYQPIVPSGKTLIEGYRTDIMGAGPRFNPLNTERPQSSVLVDLNDPIQVHLLTETALSDSKEYEILSQEEVDSLKKQVTSLTQRIEQARSNLAVQSKYLDAARSISKLYSTKKKNALLGNMKQNVEGSAKEAEMERQACEKRCEDLASELFQLERRLMEPQRRLIQHTAGILQLTHRASKSPSPMADGAQQNGIPGSPESLYTYNNLRYSLADGMPAEDAFFDDRSLYMTLEELDERSGRPTRGMPNAIAIPVKSPIREQTSQLREEADRLKSERDGLRAAVDSIQLEMDALQRESAERLKLVTGTEDKLEGLSRQLRAVIVEFNPTKNSTYQQAPAGRLEPGDMTGSHLDYLSKGLAAVQEEQRSNVSQVSEGSRDAEMAASRAAAMVAEAEVRLLGLNRDIHVILQSFNASQQAPPDALGPDFEGQLGWLQGSIGAIESGLAQANRTSSASSTDKQKVIQMDSVLRDMWNTIQDGYADINKRKEDRRRTRREAGLGDEEEEDEEDLPFDPNEEFSLPAFQAKVQWLYSQATNLREQKSVLKRQIKQQRELNSKSDAQKDADLQSKMDELSSTRGMLVASEARAQEAQQKLAKAQQDMEELKAQEVMALANVGVSSREADGKIQERDAKIATLESQLKERETLASSSESQVKERDIQIAASLVQLQERDTKITAVEEQLQQRDMQLKTLESTSRELQEKLGEVEASVVSLSAQLLDATEAKTTAEAKAATMEKDIKEKEDEFERLNGMVIELKTELTFAKAELDGAYGSRQQRAADVAALGNTAEITALNSQIEKLKKELESTLRDFEALTKDTISAERERVEMESKLDDALASKSILEAEAEALRDKLDSEVARLQEMLDAERLKATSTMGAAGSPRPGAGASMLSEQFRATMKEERKRFQEEMRGEQAIRRKIEEELRSLKRAQASKSPLSPR